ncbi:MAG: AgmX/PglI C-terminal domain-containing protein [Myxococcota bacterium]
MDECPFCGQDIDDALARFGGTCPHCFTEIPGEEAATDPGAAPGPVPAVSDRRLPIALAIGVGAFVGLSLMMLAGVGWRWTQRAQASTPVLDFDALPIPDVVEVDAAPPKGASSAPRVARADRFVGGGTEVGAASDAANALSNATPSRRSSTGPRRVRSDSGRASLPKVGPSLGDLERRGTAAIDLSLGGGTVNRDDNVVLDDPLAIRMMIGDRLRRGIAELRGCYDRRLKQRPDLSGRWKLTFTVSSEGRATEANLVGLDRKDAKLERCLEDHVLRRWAFAQVSEPTEVSKTLTFHVGR